MWKLASFTILDLCFHFFTPWFCFKYVVLSVILVILNLSKQNVKEFRLNFKKEYKPEAYLGPPQHLRSRFLGY